MCEMSQWSMNTCTLKVVPPFWRMNFPAVLAAQRVQIDQQSPSRRAKDSGSDRSVV
jgi:hypothetical protein